jgi:hypothetical protein
MSQLPQSQLDRRQSPRTKLVEITYIGMGPENGGLVLDVSDGGLSFHSVAPVRQAETIRFLLSLQDQNRIEGSGEVVWTNEAGTVCGLKFTSLSSGARQHLSHWTSASRTPSSEPDATAAPVPAAPLATPAAEPAPPIQQPVESSVNQADGNSEPLFALPPVDQLYPSQAPEGTHPGGQLFLWILFVLAGAAIIAAAFLYGVHVGQSQISSVARPGALTASESPQTASPPSMPSPAGSSAGAPVPGAPTSASIPPNSAPGIATPAPGAAPKDATKAVDTSASLSPNPASAGGASALVGQHAKEMEDASKSQLAAAFAYLNGENGPRDSAKAAKALWTAVGSGNSDAEIVLAGLYAAGDGVPKSCEQARVLLIAAERSGNSGARAKLDGLKTSGCK